MEGSREVNERKTNSNNFHFFKKLMLSWIPPAVALAFVLSFELGRREKVRFEARNRRVSKGGETNSMQITQNSPTSLSDGVIDVSD